MAVINITQFIRPDGKRAEIPVDIPDELKGIAEGLEISCEGLTNQRMVVYAHRRGEDGADELTELADAKVGDNQPAKALERLIRRFEKKPFKPALED